MEVMRRIPFLILLFSIFEFQIAFASQAAPQNTLSWADLDVNEKVELQQTLVVNSELSLAAGSRYGVIETLTLDPVPVMVFTLHALSCNAGTDPKPVDMTILADTYGFEWKKTCTANFYVEFKDLGQASYFRP